MVRMFAIKFPHYHPRRGQKTYFPLKIKKGEKIHTFREGYGFKVGILTMKNWKGRPYHTGQKQFYPNIMADVQKFVLIKTKQHLEIYIEEEGDFRKIDEQEAAANDGLSFEDFRNWFKKSMKGQIIHWTDFRY